MDYLNTDADVSVNAESGMITNLVVSPGNAYDGYKLPEFVNRDLERGLPTTPNKLSTISSDAARFMSSAIRASSICGPTVGKLSTMATIV